MKFNVVTFGSATHDIFLTSDGFKISKDKGTVYLCEEYGGKLTIKDRISTTGGGATNTAVCFERLGLQSAIVACVGDKHWGRLVRHNLQEEGVSLLYLQKSNKYPTSSSVIMVGEDGGRTILVHRAASNHLNWKQVDWQRLNSDWAYVSSLGGDMVLLNKIVNWSQQKNIKLAINPGSKELLQADKLYKILKNFYIFIINKQELELFAKNLGQNDKLSDLSSLGPSIFMVTDGKKGADIYLKSGEVIHQKAVMAKAIEETGAGDAFGSTFVAGIIKNKTVQDSLKMAAINSSNVVQHIGPKEGLLFYPEIKKQMVK